MKTNKYLEQYMRLKCEESENEKSIKELSWQSKDRNITITPTHFNYFYFYINAGEDSGILVDEIREMAKWVLKTTEGLDNETHHFVSEIIKREK